MRCPNCGAAMRLVREKDYFACDYCTAFHFPDEESRDGVRVVEGETDRDCPVCQVPLARGAIEQQPVLYCLNCRGVLTARSAFMAIMRRKRSSGPHQPRPLDPSELERQIDCPGCGNRMQTHPYHGPGAMVIDTCGGCALMWLDHGELEAIVAANEASRTRRW